MADTYCAKYGGLVKDNQDPDKLGKLKVWVPSLFLEEDAAWATPALPYGVFFLPEVATTVWVEFEGGDPDLPIWTGIRQAPDAWAPEADPPTRRVVRTLAGHLVVFDDKAGDEAIEVHDGKSGSSIVMNKDGIQVKHGSASHAVTLDGSGITVTHGAGASKVMVSSDAVKVEAAASTVEIGASGVTVRSSATITVQGTSVALGGAGGRPVLRLGDTGVGNLGAPVPLIGPGSPIVLAV